MARVSEWFPEWAATLRDRSGRQDWPDATSESGLAFWDDFERALVRIGATFDHADEASSAACDVLGLYPNQFRPIVVEAVRKLQARDQSSARGHSPGSIDEARLASKGCPRCGGSGLVVATAPADRLFTSAGGAAMPAGSTFGSTCPCPMGEAIQRADADLPASKRNRIPRLADLPMACYPLPAEEPGAPATRDDALAMLRSLVAGSRDPGRPDRRPHPRSPHQRDARGVLGDVTRPDLSPVAAEDPVVGRELSRTAPSRPAQPADLAIPEDDPNWC